MKPRKEWYKYTDQFGRSRPNGIRRVFKGKRAHDGRPLPFSLQVRPQRAAPTFHSHRNNGSIIPWYGDYDRTMELLQAGKPIPGLLRATAKSNKKNTIYYTINIIKNNKSRIVYKINKKDSCVAFGILKALVAYTGRENLCLCVV